MPLEPGARIGPYFIDREIGRGGMGVVYLAKDPRLQRDVAIKALPDHVAEDPARLERFQSEAQALAQLNHPSVAGIHGVEEEGSLRYLVLEYVEGETLSDRLARGPLAVDEAIDLGIRIASGVEAAHEAGVVHRDLKPDNIRLTPEGEVKILDFGLAKVGDGGASSSGLSATVAGPAQHSPTMPGTILGTAAYMSPEQARGRGVDRRTDVWAFGVVLYECLTGASPFAGDSASDSIGAVLHKDVDFDRLPAETPAHVRRVLARCLVRDKARRLRDMGDVRLELETGDGEAGAAVASAATSRATTIALAAIAILAAAGWGFTALRATSPVEDAPVHLSINLPDGMEIFRSIDISPDGRTVVFSGRMDGEQWIYLRSLDDFDLRRVGSSRDGFEPTFSPDGSSILFYARGQIFRASVSGGNPVSLARAPWMMADWDEDGAILFSEGLGSPLWRMPAGGGEATPVTDLADDGAYAHVWPKRIPGTSKVLFTSWTTAESGGARILDLDTGEMRPLATEMPDRRFTPTPRWSASGHLILENWDAGLSVLPFDPASDERVSIADARPLLGGVFHMGSATRSVFALSDEGTFVYAPGFLNAGRRLVWVDEDGTVTPIVDQSDVSGGRLGGTVSLAPDGTTIVTGMGTDLVEVDLRRGISRQLTFDGGNELEPVYFPEGDRVLYSSNVDVRWSLWTVGRGSAATPEMLLQRDENTYGLDVALDGTILFGEQSQDTGDDIYLLMPDGEVRSLVATPADERQAVFSTDGRWVAYQSDVSGRSEVYLTSVDGTSAPVQVSSGGGTSPQFGPGGQTLYFRRHRQVLRVGFADGQPIGETEQVFDAPNLAGSRAYDFVDDESRMIAVQVDDDAVPSELRVVTDFFRVIEGSFDDGAR